MERIQESLCGLDRAADDLDDLARCFTRSGNHQAARGLKDIAATVRENVQAVRSAASNDECLDPIAQTA